MKIRTRSLLILSTIFITALSACGGGGSSSSGASNISPYSSSLVVGIDNNEAIAGLSVEREQHRSIGVFLTELLVSRALAATAGVPIYIDGKQIATTDTSGTAVIPLYPGNYELCILNTVAENCIAVEVNPDSVVVIDGVNIDAAENVTYNGIDIERAQDHIVEFEDPNNSNKTIICHKGKMTISVGTPAAQQGHFKHGDSLGACQNVAKKESNADKSKNENNKNKKKST